MTYKQIYDLKLKAMELACVAMAGNRASGDFAYTRIDLFKLAESIEKRLRPTYEKAFS